MHLSIGGALMTVASGGPSGFPGPPQTVAGLGGLHGGDPQLWVPGCCLDGFHWCLSQHLWGAFGPQLPITAHFSRNLSAPVCMRAMGWTPESLLRGSAQLLTRARSRVCTPSA